MTETRVVSKIIKNEQWQARVLQEKIERQEIYKPKYQRKRKWDILPKKDSNPSERKYIEFLFDTHNSVHAITFGKDGDRLSNIDGNNRINAIMHFLNKPFELFPEKLEPIKLSVEESICIAVANQIEGILLKMNYDELMSFKYKISRLQFLGFRIRPVALVVFKHT